MPQGRTSLHALVLPATIAPVLLVETRRPALDDGRRGFRSGLGLWRLRDFDITRIEAPEDVLIYHCIARDNAAAAVG